MKRWPWFNAEGAFILAGLVISMTLVFLFPVPDALIPPQSIITGKQDELKVLPSGAYPPEQYIIAPEEKKYTVWLYRGTAPVLRFPAGTRVGEILQCHSNRLMYIPTSPVWKTPVGKFPCASVVYVKDNNDQTVYYRTYFENNRYHLPVISLIVNNNEMFDAQNGMGVQGVRQGRVSLRTKWWDMPGGYKQKGKEYETVGRMEYFDRNGHPLYSAFAGIRIHGNATRAFPQKSLRLAALKENEHRKKFYYDFFGAQSTPRALILRNGGNDWGRTLISDACMQGMVSDLGVDAQTCVPVILYLNGEYWGIYSLREKVDEYYLAQKYHCSKKQITLVEMDEMKSGKKKVFRSFLNLVNDLCQRETTDEKVIRILSEEIDMQNFMNYLFTEMYFANTDWPHNNCKYYKVQNEKWRWIVYDLDYGYGYIGNPEAYQIDLFDVLLKSNGITAKIFKILMKVPLFRHQFAEHCRYLMKHKLNLAAQLKAINAFSRMIQPEIHTQIRRWRKPISVEQWEQYVNGMRIFAQHRSHIFEKQLLKYCH